MKLSAKIPVTTMKNVRISCLVFSLFLSSCGISTFFKPDAPATKTMVNKPGTGKSNAEAYIEQFKNMAIKEMNANGIPASITLAQGLLESGNGKSDLAVQANNHFGIKCHKEWTGPSIKYTDDEENECFRKYDDPSQSFKDHSNFLKNRPNYVDLFLLDPVDDTAWAYGLKKAGYATDSEYPKKLLKIIDDYELAQYNFPELANEIEVEVRIAGIGKLVKVSYSKGVLPGNYRYAIGTTSLNLSDFELKPSEKLFGLIRLNNKVIINFRFNFEFSV